MTDDLAVFLDVLYGDVEDAGFLELRALPSRRRVFVPLVERHVSGAIEHFLEDCQARQQNAYFGVAVRYRHGGDKDACSLLTALYCDLDERPATARARLDAFPLPPTLVVASGGGLHAYWRLKEPLDLRVPAERDDAERALRRLALALGSDPAVAECARVLRLPGSFNYKPQYGTTPPEVTLVVH